MRLWFAAVKAIDFKLAQFAQQTELFKPHGLSLEMVEAKFCAALKAKASTGLRAAHARRQHACRLHLWRL
jgi:hypothetical protein